MAARKMVERRDTFANVVENAFSELEELGTELRDWYDNMPENLQGSSKGDEVSEAADALENLSCPDIPDSLAALDFVYLARESTRLRRSRRERRDDALSPLYAAVETLDDLVSEWREAEKARTDGTTDERISDAEEFRDEIQALIDDSENVDFPGR